MKIFICFQIIFIELEQLFHFVTFLVFLNYLFIYLFISYTWVKTLWTHVEIKFVTLFYKIDMEKLKLYKNEDIKTCQK